MFKVCADECETDSSLASDQEFIWQPKLYPNPPVWPLTWTLKCVYLSMHISPHFQISWHYGACWWWQVHLTLAEKFKSHPTTPIYRASYILLEAAFTSHYCTFNWMAGWFIVEHTHITLLSPAHRQRSNWEFGRKCVTIILSFSVCFSFALSVPLLFFLLSWRDGGALQGRVKGT